MPLQHPCLCLARPCLPYLVPRWKLSVPSPNMLLTSPNMLSEQRVKSTNNTANGPYQAYFTPYSSWMTVEANYIHMLFTNQPLLVPSLGVGAGVDEEDHIAHAHAHTDPPFPQFLPQPLLPKSKGKRRARQQITPLPDSDDNITIVEDPATSPCWHHRYSGSDNVEVVSPVPSRQSKRPCLAISTWTASLVPSLTSSTSASSSNLSTPSSPDFPAALLPTLYSYKSHH
ncbi:hypothetical protein DFH08DRAFT_808704 [Mycena albidolilacea]|uniref:Uncharacterized protein n=1 Tax=Mycena albidolilacea TaxID=1033008 RepID=A0AAD7ERY8_9AGAR|nr:hypothetical protein DFH08DRAFT_808704 [Mycena albidolilacea]